MTVQHNWNLFLPSNTLQIESWLAGNEFLNKLNLNSFNLIYLRSSLHALNPLVELQKAQHQLIVGVFATRTRSYFISFGVETVDNLKKNSKNSNNISDLFYRTFSRFKND